MGLSLPLDERYTSPRGHDLYSFFPEKYATADRWILQYLKGDQEILKHIGPDGDDTAGVLFVRFVEENLRKQGLSLRRCWDSSNPT